MENFKGTEGNLSLAEDHRAKNDYNQFIIMAGTTMVATITRQNQKEFGPKKFSEPGILQQDPIALANAQLFIAAKDMFEALSGLLNMIDEAKELDNDEIIAPLNLQRIRKAKKAISKAKGYV